MKGFAMLENIVSALLLGAFVAVAPIDGDIVPSWAQYGLAGLVVGCMIWRDVKREERMSEQIQKMNEKMIEMQTTTIKENTSALNELKSRPCLFSKK